jgi:hypothetical protein
MHDARDTGATRPDTTTNAKRPSGVSPTPPGLTWDKGAPCARGWWRAYHAPPRRVGRRRCRRDCKSRHRGAEGRHPSDDRRRHRPRPWKAGRPRRSPSDRDADLVAACCDFFVVSGADAEDDAIAEPFHARWYDALERLTPIPAQTTKGMRLKARAAHAALASTKPPEGLQRGSGCVGGPCRPARGDCRMSKRQKAPKGAPDTEILLCARLVGLHHEENVITDGDEHAPTLGSRQSTPIGNKLFVDCTSPVLRRHPAPLQPWQPLLPSGGREAQTADCSATAYRSGSPLRSSRASSAPMRKCLGPHCYRGGIGMNGLPSVGRATVSRPPLRRRGHRSLRRHRRSGDPVHCGDRLLGVISPDPVPS